jgi:hypothetical protein
LSSDSDANGTAATGAGASFAEAATSPDAGIGAGRVVVEAFDHAPEFRQKPLVRGGFGGESPVVFFESGHLRGRRCEFRTEGVEFLRGGFEARSKVVALAPRPVAFVAQRVETRSQIVEFLSERIAVALFHAAERGPPSFAMAAARASSLDFRSASARNGSTPSRNRTAAPTTASASSTIAANIQRRRDGLSAS